MQFVSIIYTQVKIKKKIINIKNMHDIIKLIMYLIKATLFHLNSLSLAKFNLIYFTIQLTYNLVFYNYFSLKQFKSL